MPLGKRTPEMIDLHTHTLFSDGGLLLSELVRRAEVCGYRAINISDHADLSNLDFLVPRVVRACAELGRLSAVRVVAGIEITHCPLEQIPRLVKEARRLGAQLVTVHGETLSEPVIPGTNRAAIEAGADILAHPGLISEADARLAARKGVCLEISGRKGHCLANGHVVKVARACGAKLVFGTDSHDEDDLVSREQSGRILRAAGLEDDEVETVWRNADDLVTRALAGGAR
jgi:histidinol phosphatase-like PHP family hydrolase